MIESQSIELLPPDVSTEVSALDTLDQESQARAVTALLSHSRTGLLAAIAAQDLPGVVEYKAKAAAIQEITKQLRLGKELQLDAAEFVRRAERGIGVAIRQGQANGDIAAKGESRGPQSDYMRNGKVVHVDPLPDEKKVSPARFFSGGGETHEVYALTDNVSDAAFEEALAEAKAEGNLSRANVARKAKAKAAQPKPKPQPEPAPPLLPGKKPKGPKANSTEMLENIEGMLGAIVQTCQYINPADIDPAKGAALVRAVYSHVANIRRTMKEITNA